ncbi:hypothetical protein NWP13_23730, partial [Rhodococcus pyridinivorans]|nr:hypothetical protein [Rhodococcus pyridinivorans]
MTYPVGGAPDGSFRIGNVGDAQDLNESSVKSIIRGKNLPPWENAQGQLGESYARGEYVHREVTRLDNRIDVIADELGVMQLASYGFSDRWQKPAGAFGDIVFDIMGGASGGGRSNNGGSGGSGRNGLGGYSGGWHRITIPAADCPAFLDIVVGGTAAGANSDGGQGENGKASRVVTLSGTVLGEATGGSTAERRYGSGNNTYRVRGGNGGTTAPTDGEQGGRGSFDVGGRGGPSGSSAGEGENGFSVPATKIGVGSGGGGGGANSFLSGGSGAKGGDGGWPSGPGGGGGAYRVFGFAGNGGIGSAG